MKWLILAILLTGCSAIYVGGDGNVIDLDKDFNVENGEAKTGKSKQ